MKNVEFRKTETEKVNFGEKINWILYDFKCCQADGFQCCSRKQDRRCWMLKMNFWSDRDSVENDAAMKGEAE